MYFEIAIFLAAVAAVFFVWRNLFSRIVIYDFQKGLLYKKGSFLKLLNAGQYYYLKSETSIEVIDVRKSLVTLPGQDVLTKDNVNIKITLVGFYEVTDPFKAKSYSADYVREFYNNAQIILRDLVANYTIDELLEKKGEIDSQLLAGILESASQIGLTIFNLSVKDIMLPANLKRAFSGILEAKKEAQTQLEKARGEQAVLRSLANSAKLYETHPMLFQARLVQSLSTGTNSIVFGADGKITVVEKP